MAYFFADRQTGDSIDTIPVSRTGWTDIADVRQIATRWLRSKGT